MKSECLFCRLIHGEERAWKVWEDGQHVAFLTPFPNTPGFTVVAPVRHLPSYLFALEEEQYQALMAAGRRVGRLLDEALGTRRTAMIAEGMAIDHAHLKLAPLHGLPAQGWEPVTAAERAFSPHYQGFVTSLDGPRAPDEALDQVAERVRATARRLEQGARP